MTRRWLVSCFLAAALVAVGTIWWSQAGPVPPVPATEVAGETAPRAGSRDEDDELAIGPCRDFLQFLVENQRRRNLNVDQAQRLSEVREVLSRVAERANGVSGAKRTLAVVHRQRALADLVMRDFHASETSLRESLRLAESALRQSDDVSMLHLQALNELTLCWLLAETGRADQAELVCKQAISKWVQLSDAYKSNPHFSICLAEAHRNLAILMAARGNDGIGEAEKSVNAASRAGTLPDDEMIALDALVDSQQVLASLLHRQGRPDDARAVCQASIDRLEYAIRHIEGKYDQSATYPRPERYQDALAFAEENLASIQPAKPVGDSEAPGVVSAVEAHWKWRMLNLNRGQVLAFDRLSRGGLAPGEFEWQDALLLSWHEEWSRDVILQMLEAIPETLPVILLVEDARQRLEASRQIKEAGIPLERVRFEQLAADTCWVRDYGPFTTRTRAGVPYWIDPMYAHSTTEYRFEDDELPQRLALAQQVDTVAPTVLLEGGAMLHNGRGLSVISADLVRRNAEMGIGKEQLVDVFHRHFGTKQLVELEPLEDDPTAHIDWFCAFTSADTIVVGSYSAEDPANRDRLDAHARKLAQCETPSGKLNVVRIPMPPRGSNYFGGSYTNVIFANGVLLVPTWPDASAQTEQQALDVYRRLLPDWRIVTIPSHRLGVHGGGPRCISMHVQLPDSRPALHNEPDGST